MKPKEIFMSHIYAESYLNFTEEYLSQLKASIELMRRGNVDGNTVSNSEFGWQSNVLPHSGPFEKLTKKITEKAFVFCKNLKNFNFGKVEISSLWANINYKGDINWPHKHQGNLAGVFYLDTHENCGDLILDSFNFNQHCKISSYLSSKEKVIVVPKNNKIVLFDSNCMHYVTKNLSDKIRISMSFNIKIYD
jgi:uncharacterized protein (TIGR02466 family)|tara:strand:+ start:93 stop:668 length:576 start_codon:yes stop_codon:yes gene_type:complete